MSLEPLIAIGKLVRFACRRYFHAKIIIKAASVTTITTIQKLISNLDSQLGIRAQAQRVTPERCMHVAIARPWAKDRFAPASILSLSYVGRLGSIPASAEEPVLVDNDHVERIARGLCREAGRHPDELIDPEIVDRDLAVQPPPEKVPAWTAYVDKAGTYVAAARALKWLG